MIRSWRAWHPLQVACLLVMVGLLLAVGGGAWHGAEGGAVETAAVWAIGTVGQSPLITGVRVVKTGMGNIPERLSNGAAAHSPGNNMLQTYYWQK